MTKRTAQETWDALLQLTFDDELDSELAKSTEERRRELAEAGFDIDKVNADADAFFASLTSSPSSEPSPGAEPSAPGLEPTTHPLEPSPAPENATTADGKSAASDPEACERRFLRSLFGDLSRVTEEQLALEEEAYFAELEPLDNISDEELRAAVRARGEPDSVLTVEDLMALVEKKAEELEKTRPVSTTRGSSAKPKD